MKFQLKIIFILFLLICFKHKIRMNTNAIKMSFISTLPYKIIDKIPYKVTNHIDADIVLCPSGRYGAYQLGICHYIKNNFIIKNKKILGFSAGSLNAIFMSIKTEHTHECLKEFFKIKSKKIPTILKKTMNVIESYHINDYNMENIYIGVSTINGLIIYNNFITIQDITRCCIASSFVPYITHNDIFYFYKNNLSIDGGIYHKKYLESIDIENNHQNHYQPLVIKYTMFGRHANINMFNELLKKNKPSTYQLYITGYHDAKENHSYFEKYLSCYSSSYSS